METFRRRERVPLSVDEARRRATDYLLRIGYRPSSAGEPLTFTRGSALSTLVSFSPRGWQARAAVFSMPSGDSTEVDVTLEADATGQIVTAGERQYLERELDGLTAVLRGEHPAQVAAALSDSGLVRQNLLATGLAAGAGLLVMLLTVLVWWQSTGTPSGGVGIGCGAGTVAALVVLGISILWLRRG